MSVSAVSFGSQSRPVVDNLYSQGMDLHKADKKKEAFLCFLEGAKAGDVGCMYQAAHYLLWEPYVTPRDIEAARVWVDRGVEKGSADCLAIKGLYCLHGWEGGLPDSRRALAIMEEAYRQGSSMGRFYLAVFLINGIQGEFDKERGIRLLQEGVDAGDADSIAEMGRCLICGLGVPENREEGRALLERASKVGNRKAYSYLFHGCRLWENYFEYGDKLKVYLRKGMELGDQNCRYFTSPELDWCGWRDGQDQGDANCMSQKLKDETPEVHLRRLEKGSRINNPLCLILLADLSANPRVRHHLFSKAAQCEPYLFIAVWARRQLYRELCSNYQFAIGVAKDPQIADWWQAVLEKDVQDTPLIPLHIP